LDAIERLVEQNERHVGSAKVSAGREEDPLDMHEGCRAIVAIDDAYC
jgi:hypothetical protein